MRSRKSWWPAVVSMVVLLLVLSGVSMAQAPARGGGAATTAEAPSTPPAAEAPPATTGPAMGQGQGIAPSAETRPVGEGGAEGQPTGSGLGKWALPAMMVALLLVFVLMGRKPRQEEKKRQEMLSNIKKGDKVTTIGGILGTIVEIRDNEVVVKVDETSNTRMRFVRSAIRIVGTADEPAKKDENK